MTRHWIIGFILLSLIQILAACQQTTKPNPDPSDKTAPTLLSSIPKTGLAAIPTNSKLAFTFSEAMDKGSLELTATPTLNVSTPTWNTNNQSVVFANDALTPLTNYTLNLKAKDVAGNALAATTITFTTSDMADTTAPTTPTGLAATPGNAQVTLTWQANTESDVAGYTLYWGSAQNALSSSVFVTDTSKTITGLSNDTPYFFAIDALDTANNHSEKTTPITATPSSTPTDTTPKLLFSEPENGALNVLPNPGRINLTFSQAINPATFEYEFAFVKPENITMLEWNAAFTQVSLFEILEPMPNAPIQSSLAAVAEDDILDFEAGTTYAVTWSAQDTTGKNISGKLTFSTGPTIDTTGPQVTAASPAEGAVVTTQTPTIDLTFSEYILEDIQNDFAITVNGSPYTGNLLRYVMRDFNEQVTKAQFIFRDTLPLGASVSVTVAATITDVFGNPMAAPYSLNFSVTDSSLGSLNVNITGAPGANAKVVVTGPNNYASGEIDSSRTLTDLQPGTYTATATGFAIALGKPNCKFYIPDAETQDASVSAGGTATINVNYTATSCDEL
jgi:hypothetical protein